MSDERCEPAEELRDVVGWHWVGKPGDKFSEKPYLWGHRWKWAILGRGSPEVAYAHGWRYICPIPSPADVAAAKEREAALVGALKGLLLACEYTANRSGGEYSANIGPHAYAAVDALNAHAPNWRTAP